METIDHLLAITHLVGLVSAALIVYVILFLLVCVVIAMIGALLLAFKENHD